ncbi:MAG TPA: cupin domain-containing protein [Roseiflexaceae bacterium]
MSPAEAKNRVTSKNTAEHYTWGERCDGWRLVDRAELSVIHERMPPGAAEVWHHHQVARQFFFVLSGTATMEIDGARHTLGAHEGIEIAPGAPHQMRNDSTADVEFLVISQPTTRGDRVIGGPRAHMPPTGALQSRKRRNTRR